MKKRTKTWALALAGAVTGATLLSSGSASAAPSRLPWQCKEELPPGRNFEAWHCGYGQFQLRQPDVTINPGPGPDPTPPYAS